MASATTRGRIARVGAKGNGAQAVTVSVVIAGGGTGGHVYPGLALAEAIRRRSPDAEITFVGTKRGLETSAVPTAGFDLELVDVLPYSRPLGAKRFLAPLTAVRAVGQARRILKRRRVRVVAGMGGYASLPVALAARSIGVPLVIHEQNAVPGKANRLAARFTKRVAVTFEESASMFPGPVRVTGNPVRPAIASIDRPALRADALKEFALSSEHRTILVLGGSLGAKRLNQEMVSLARAWNGRDVQFLIVAGRAHEAEVRALAAGMASVVVAGYVERMELAYAAADLVVGRSGAGITEIACAGLPSILVPYPYHRDRQQEANARSLERAGGAVVVLDAQASAAHLGSEVDRLLSDPRRLEEMGRAARSFARPSAADDLAAWVLEAAGA